MAKRKPDESFEELLARHELEAQRMIDGLQIDKYLDDRNRKHKKACVIIGDWPGQIGGRFRIVDDLGPCCDEMGHSLFGTGHKLVYAKVLRVPVSLEDFINGSTVEYVETQVILTNHRRSTTQILHCPCCAALLKLYDKTRKRWMQ